MGLMPSGKAAVVGAVNEARRLGAQHIGTQHILLALAAPTDGATPSALNALGVTPAQVREATLAALKPK